MGWKKKTGLTVGIHLHPVSTRWSATCTVADKRTSVPRGWPLGQTRQEVNLSCYIIFTPRCCSRCVSQRMPDCVGDSSRRCTSFYRQTQTKEGPEHQGERKGRREEAGYKIDWVDPSAHASSSHDKRSEPEKTTRKRQGHAQRFSAVALFDG